MNKTEIIQKIKQLESLSNDEKAYLVNLVNTKKKYGLVWEDKPEDVEEQLRTQLPVLREVVDRRIEASPNPSKGGEKEKTAKTHENLQQSLFEPENIEQSSSSSSPMGRPGGAPNHILIEGDNLHALTALTFTHEGAIDVIYIDPPYNTGNKDFKYNDSFVDKEDSYRHSKWLSFMEKRLKIAKRLLSETGVVFISIDDNENAQLKLLCDEIFTQQNFIANIAIINNLKGRSDDKYIATAHENLLIYKKGSFETLGVKVPDKYVSGYKLKDDKGIYRLQGLRKRGSGALKEDRPNMFYPFYYNKIDELLRLERNNDSDIEIIPKLSDGKEGRWRWGKETSIKRINDLCVTYIKNRGEYDVIQKDYLHINEGELKRIKPKSFWDGSEFSSDAGTKVLKEIINGNKFNNPKPVGLINYCLVQSTKKHAIILDFFAGSGTTLHATMQLNAEDGGNRQCILVTNNENNIAEEVCYERNRRVIKGYTNSKGVEVPGLTNNNLRYYKSEFVESAKTEENRRKLTFLSTELLQIKEDCYHPVELPETVKPQHAQAFTNEKGKYMLVVYYHRTQHETSAVLTQWIKSLLDVEGKIKLYGFSPETEVLVNDFFEVATLIDPVPLPDAIYNAYRNTFRTLKINKRDQIRKSQATINATGENENAESEESVQTDLF